LFEARLHFIKLDAAVVQGVATDAVQREFVRSVVAMLQGLSLEVYAEGVSDDHDAETLLSLGVDGISGPWASARQPGWTQGIG
jgi:EAL domain-containing protein (putative c-di-GMP-specific phosphodiesterase class I)